MLLSTEPSKVAPFARSNTYFGFVWDVQEKTAALPRTKADKYLEAIAEWNEKPKHGVDEVRRLYGKLLHASLVVPSGRARLVGLERALGLACARPFLPLRPPRSVPGELEWWTERLQRPVIKRSVVIPDALTDVGAFSDASTGTGIGIIVGSRWRAWRLLPGWRMRDGQRDIGWAEAVGFLLLILTVTKLVPAGTPLRFWGDNDGVVRAWRNRRSRNAATNRVFQLALDHLEEHGFGGCAFPAYVPTDKNPADGPSRGIFPPSHLLLPPVDLPPSLAPYIIDALQPRSPEEVTPLHKGEACAATSGSQQWSGESEDGFWPSVEDDMAALADAVTGDGRDEVDV